MIGRVEILERVAEAARKVSKALDESDRAIVEGEVELSIALSDLDQWEEE